MDNVIYHDFTAKREECQILFTPWAEEDNDEIEELFNIEYITQPCLFGWEVICFPSWSQTAYPLGEFYKTQVVAETYAEAHRVERLADLASQFNDAFEEILDD